MAAAAAVCLGGLMLYLEMLVYVMKRDHPPTLDTYVL
jgi:hypothetical protein